MEMNISAMLGDNGYEVYDGPMGPIRYNIVELGKKLQRENPSEITEICVTNYGESRQVFVYSFKEDYFIVKRWVKKGKLNKSGY